MSEIILLVPLFFLVVNLTLARVISDYNQVFNLFIWGAIGWFVAFVLRLIPLQILQVVFLLAAGADLSDNASIEANTTIMVLIWGPLLAGLFEGYFRYWVLKKKPDVFRYNRLRLPAVVGLGWSTGEIIVIYVQAYISTLVEPVSLSFVDLLPGIVERISATFLHVALTIMVVYALFKEDNRKSLGVSMIIHTMFDSVILIFILGPGVDDIAELWLLEVVFFVMGILVLLFVIYWWRPRLEKKIGTSKWLEIQ